MTTKSNIVVVVSALALIAGLVWAYKHGNEFHELAALVAAFVWCILISIKIFVIGR